jgi:hypothetical protein
MKTIFAAALLLALIPVPASAHCNWPSAHPYCPPEVYVHPHHPAPPVYVAPPIVQYRDQIVRQPIIIVPRTLVVPEYQYAQPQYVQPQYAPPPPPQYQPQYQPQSTGDYWTGVVDALEAARQGDQSLTKENDHVQKTANNRRHHPRADGSCIGLYRLPTRVARADPDTAAGRPSELG